ncbi:cysteine synthase A [Aliikangiella sp. G2MR2-5]|uniref:cysteine synthase A n=1 Tax=Aliikangiella sp. G2MR2-5 TaxID=2788943 RepID=UPI0018A9FFAC|nr:cysteine synthase A [Aliikangiella sp. G2MR2-5]
MLACYNNILETIGNTPVVKINRLAPEHVNIFVKIESFNPLGSVKDRLALGVIERAEKDGVLKPGMTVVEATSGNTGLGLAMVCAQKGYPLVVTMAENFSIERRKMLRFLGAKVVLTPAEKKGSGMLAKATELAEKHGWFLCRQFENEANANIHSQTTAREILQAFETTSLDYWVTGYGTGGTLKGVARVLREESPKTQIIACEPENAPLLYTEKSSKTLPTPPMACHSAFRPHVVQGWTPDFIPKLTGDVVAAGFIDKIELINGEKALECARQLAKKEGIFCGISSGATFSGALQVAREAPEGSNILCMLPDTGERYLSTQLFDNISEEMTDEEWDISRSTAGFRFDLRTSMPPSQVEKDSVLDPRAVKFVSELISDRSRPVVLFALEWCEFCWSVRKFFTRIGVQFESVDLDSLEYQKDDWGGKVRQALNAHTGSVTIPQIFVGEQFIGGCTDLFDSFNQGELQKLFSELDITFEQSDSFDAYSMLPKWIQPR